MKDSLESLLLEIRKDILLKPYTTFRIGGPAKYFFVARTTEDIIQALKAARKTRTPFFVLGGGSNLLVSDKGFPGLVVKIENCKLKIENVKVYAEAGVDFPRLVRETTKRGLAGLEWAGGLPGTVGGAVRGNAGAFGGEVKDSIVQVEYIDEKGRIKKLSNKQCRFQYRSSLFKEKELIVVGATFQLRKSNPNEIIHVAQDHMRYRKERHPLEFPNAGSMFKNCDLKKIPKTLADFVKPAVKQDPFPVVPAAFLIAEAGLKGLKRGGAQISPKHPNFIVNMKNAEAQDILWLAKKAREAVKQKFSVALEAEIQYVG